jgi:acetate kinase
MNVLVLKPRQQTVDYCLFADGWNRPVREGRLHDYRSEEGSLRALNELAQQLQAKASPALTSIRPDLIALRGVFGGDQFSGPVRVDPRMLRRLEKLVPHAPLHIPPLLALIRACRKHFARVPLVLLFETAFFVDLPVREHRYALDTELAQTEGVRRYGFHGLMHEAVCRQIARRRRDQGLNAPARVISLCLEPQPELAAITGMRPLMVTSGATPLEGLPGQTTSGELDPSIVLMLAEKKGWGYEQINQLLTQSSGWLGLTGDPVGLDTLFNDLRPEYQLAREVCLHRLLQSCGAAVAALGGVDVLAFSGRYAGIGVNLGLWLRPKLTLHRSAKEPPVSVEFLSDSVERVIADSAAATLLADRKPANAGSTAVQVKSPPALRPVASRRRADEHVACAKAR